MSAYEYDYAGNFCQFACAQLKVFQLSFISRQLRFQLTSVLLELVFCC